MHGTGDQLFSCSCLAINQHGGIGGRDRFDLFESPAQLFALSDDLLEVKFTANFRFEIDVFLRELIFKLRNLPICESVFDSESDWIGYLAEKSQIIVWESILFWKRSFSSGWDRISSASRISASYRDGIPSVSIAPVGVFAAGDICITMGYPSH